MLDELTFEEISKATTLHALAAVARDDPYGEDVWVWLCPMTLFGDLIKTTYTLTPKGQARLDEFLVKLTEGQRAEFLAKGLRAEFLKKPMEANRSPVDTLGFRCEMCHEIIPPDPNWSDADARAEAASKGIDPAESGMVCDDCYKLTPWGAPESPKPTPAPSPTEATPDA